MKVVTATEVEIFGSVYPVRSEKDPEYLQDLAQFVDRKMREIAQQVTTVDSAKIAVLAALNLSDELFQCRKLQEGERVEIQEKVTELAGRLDDPLEAFHTIDSELSRFSTELADKERLVVATKVEDEASEARAAELEAALGKPVLRISSMQRRGLHQLLGSSLRLVQGEPQAP